MKYLNFVKDKKALAYVVGSPVEDIDRVEKELGVRIPEALWEYLELFGVRPMHDEYDEHGTNDMIKLREIINEDINEYRARGFELSELRNVLTFHRFLDTYLFVPIEDGNENPPVMSFYINLAPTVEKEAESITDFVKFNYEALLKQLYRPKS